MTPELQLYFRVVLTVCSIMSTAASGADDAINSTKASYTDALTKAATDRRVKLTPALEACDKELAAALEAALAEQNLGESNRIQSLRNLLKLVTTEPWSALPPDPLQAVQSAKAHSAEREFIAASKKADASFNTLAQAACKGYISALDALSRSALKDRNLEEANAIQLARASAESDLKLGAGKFPEGALLILTFDHDAVSSKGNARALDLSGNGNDLMLGAIKLATGRVGGGLRATPDLSLHTIRNVGVDGRHPRTLAFWLRLNNPPGTAVLGWGVKGTATEFRVTVDSSQFKVWGCNPGNDFETRVEPKASQWHHHAVTYDGTTIHWMMDGVEIGGSGFNIASATPNVPFYVGACDGAGGFDGIVDEIAVYDRVLTDDEIKQLRTRSIW